MKNETARRRDLRRKEQLQFEAERGGDEADRGGDEADRGGDEADRGGDEADRGGDEADRGRVLGGFGPNHVAADIFRRAAGLGGHLVIAFVAPIATSRTSSARLGVLSSVAGSARAQMADLTGQLMLNRAKTLKQRRHSLAQAGGNGAVSASSKKPQPATSSAKAATKRTVYALPKRPGAGR